MALALILGEADLVAEYMDTRAEVTLDKVEGSYAITAVHLTLKARIPGAIETVFQELAAKTKTDCPVSKLFNAEITLDAVLLASSEARHGRLVFMKTTLKSEPGRFIV